MSFILAAKRDRNMNYAQMYPLLILFHFLHFFTPAATDLTADGSALLAFRSAVGQMVIPWNTSLSPCEWKGVTCSGDRVASLRLPGRGLIGQIPAGTLGNLSDLRILSLRRNALFGPLPSDLAGCTHLRFLNLNRNRFSGQIPQFISSFTALIYLNLADNDFSGEIPLSLNNLTNLKTLYLENNHFSGEMPNLDISNLARFNVSFNKLNGSVPAKLRGFPVNSFLGMSLCGGLLGSCPGDVSPAPADSSKLTGGAIAGIAAAAVAVFVLILVVLFLFFRRKGKADEVSSTETRAAKLPQVEATMTGKKVDATASPSPGMVVSKKQLVFFASAPRVFDLEDLLRATAEVLGKGTFGTAYKAALEMDLTVVVKRLKGVKMSEKEFAEKTEAIGAMEHPNLVPLRAFYYSREEKLLVYDYLPNGSLSFLLHGHKGFGNSPLKWESRINIALNAARGIEYIHSTSPSASHGNIKSSNILITSSSEARVSDHGIAHLVPNHVVGYLAPEAIDTQRFTQKADVFSFGVLLLELVTGKAPHEGMLNEDVNLPQWVESVIREEWTGEVFDAELMKYQSPEEEMAMLLQVGVDCTSQNPEHRPAMSAVVTKIEEIPHLAARRKDKQQGKKGEL